MQRKASKKAYLQLRPQRLCHEGTKGGRYLKLLPQKKQAPAEASACKVILLALGELGSAAGGFCFALRKDVRPNVLRMPRSSRRKAKHNKSRRGKISYEFSIPSSYDLQ